MALRHQNWRVLLNHVNVFRFNDLLCNWLIFGALNFLCLFFWFWLFHINLFYNFNFFILVIFGHLLKLNFWFLRRFILLHFCRTFPLHFNFGNIFHFNFRNIFHFFRASWILLLYFNWLILALTLFLAKPLNSICNIIFNLLTS